MPSRRRFLTTVGVGALGVAGGCLDFPMSDEEGVPGPEYPSGTLWIYNTAKSDLSVTVETVDRSPAATFERVVESGETAIRREFVSAPAGTTVTLRASVETFAEEWLSFSFAPRGGGPESDAPPQYARLHVPGADGEVDWQAREAVE